MGRTPRRGSLFWSLFASFFAVVVFALLLQIAVVAVVVEPLARRGLESRAELAAARLANRIAPDAARGEQAALRAQLAAREGELRPMMLVYVPVEGQIVAGRSVPMGWRRPLRAMLDDPNPATDEASTPRRERPGGQRGPSREFRLERLARQSVEFDGRVLGDVLVLHPRQRVPLLSALPARAVALLPVGLLVALVAGLLLSHRLQRRLFSLEAHALRVGDGDLSGRLPSPGRDEIGRVAESLNAMTERLAASSEKLRVSDTQRRQLLADITHELATPLTAIRGYAETLLDEGVEVSDPDRVRYLEDVLAAAERMDLLVRDLLDLARVEAGAGEFSPEILDLSELVRHSVERIGRAAPADAPSLEWRADAGGDTQVHADGRRLEQLVDNLLHNALRHGKAGDRVEVRVSGAEGRVRLEVRDHGSGFDPADLPHVFDRFYRADRARTTPGSGLGLAIVRAIAERHGGTARAENASPAGARLVVELPASD